jgi:hypothetical protein
MPVAERAQGAASAERIAWLHVASPAIHPWSATHVRACSRAPQELHVGHEDKERRRQEKDVLQRSHHHDAGDPLPRRGCEQPLGTAGASSPLVIFRTRKFWLPGKLGKKGEKIMGWLADENKNNE